MSGERLFAFNRIMIFSIYGVSLLLPILYPAFKTLEFSTTDTAAPIYDEATNNMSDLTAMLAQTTPATTSIGVRFLLWIYLAGLIVTSLRFLISLIMILKKTISKDRIELGNGYILVITDNGPFSPFSFFRYIVISRDDYKNSKREILIHEFTHLRKLHWLDQIFANLVAILMWYNPAAWLMIEELKSIHEYQADEAVLAAGTEIKRYQYLLIEKAVGKRFPSPANSLNHSKLKLRITMMYKSKPSKMRRLASMAVVPVTIITVAITDLPAFAGAISEIETSSLRDKVTNISSNAQMPEKENSTSASNAKISENALNASAALQYSNEWSALSANNADGLQTEKERKLVAQPVQVVGIGNYTKHNGIAVNNSNLPETTVIVGDIESVNLNSSNDAVYFINDEEVPYSEVASLAPDRIKEVAVSTIEDKITEVRFTVNDSKTEKETVYTEVDEDPKFPGGEAEMYKWISTHLKYPEAAVKRKAQGRVNISYIVDKTGKIHDCKVASGDDEDLCKEALRVVSLMPNFIPGKINGKAVDCFQTIPISFKM